MALPMTNGQVERANGMILQGLKPRIYNDLNKFGKRWMKELPSVVWSLRTTPSRATSFSPFFLVYGAEAILPTDLEYGSPRTKAYDDRSNQTSREDSLDQLEEARDMALLHSVWYQQSLRRYHTQGFGPEASRWETWYFGCGRMPEDATSLLLPRRAVHRRQDFEARDIQAGQRSRQGLQQRLEHPTATSLLPLRCFKSFIYLVLFTYRNKVSPSRKGQPCLGKARPSLRG
jgi:hypothetical protein